METVEVSLKATLKGLSPAVGLALKAASGTRAPVPLKALVLLPAAELTITTLLKLVALVGAKRTSRLVQPRPGRLNGLPERIVKGPALMLAEPLVSAAPPRLVMSKEALALAPTATVPKLRAGGETDN